MKYTTLLFDADGTILDFDKAEEVALCDTFRRFSIPYDQTILEIYRRNNNAQWQLFEQGKITKDAVLINRFENTFAELGVTPEVKKVAAYFQEELGEGHYILKNAEEVLERLYGKYRLYLVSNGVLKTQRSRMSKSRLDRFFADSFISEVIGFNKPQEGYFSYCFSHIPNFNKSETLIVGDSLTSDIQGGVNAGITAVWFNPDRKPNNTNVRPHYEITDLLQLFDIIG